MAPVLKLLSHDQEEVGSLDSRKVILKRLLLGAA